MLHLAEEDRRPGRAATGSPGGVGAKSCTTPRGRGEVQRRADRLPVACTDKHLVGEVGAPQRLAQVVRVGRGERGRAGRLGQGAPIGARLHGCDGRRAGRQCGADLQQPHRARAHDRHARARPDARAALAAHHAASGSIEGGRPLGQAVGGSASTSARAFSAGTRTSSASPPGSMRVRRNSGHRVCRPARQRAQVMQGTWWCTNTRAPAAKGAPGPAGDHLARGLVRRAPAAPAGPGTRPSGRCRRARTRAPARPARPRRRPGRGAPPGSGAPRRGRPPRAPPQPTARDGPAPPQQNADIPVISRPTIRAWTDVRALDRRGHLDVAQVAGHVVLQQQAVAAQQVAGLGHHRPGAGGVVHLGRLAMAGVSCALPTSSASRMQMSRIP